jgi:hypothetical protein
MHKTSARVRSFRSRAKPGAIMKASTFKKIARAAGGGAKGQRIAGAAYWRAAKRRAAGFAKGSKRRR